MAGNTAEQQGISPPPSPGICPVELADCIEHLLNFTLSTHLSQSHLVLGSELLLSRDYCSHLLRDDRPLRSLDAPANNSVGVPVFPLYKRLAHAMHQSITSGAYSGVPESNACIPIHEPFKEKEKERDQLIVDKGSGLTNMLKSVEFELHVQEPYFSHLLSGRKSVEGRCAVGNYNRIASGSVLLINKCLLMKVENVRMYGSFSEMLRVEGLSHVLPGVKTIEEGVKIYLGFYTKEKELSNGVLAISVLKPTYQPYNCLADLLSGLGCEGVGGLLGMAHTDGTVADALPPPRSALLSSSMNPLRPDIKGCSLTDAARALAKHVNRSSEGWWGSFSGSDSVKNERALEVVKCLLSQCCWMNAHLLQPNEGVFEIRVREGYGARWSLDGSKFVGFLEPYTEDGYSKGWRN